MNKEVIEKILKSISEEAEMYSENLSPNVVDYICKLRKMEKSLKCDLDKINGTWTPKEKKNKDDDSETYVDNDLRDMIDEYQGYLHYKTDYEKTNDKKKLEMSHQELGHFLKILEEMFDEICEHSKNNIDEKNMIKTTIKSIYTKVG